MLIFVRSFVAFFMLFITFYPCNAADHVDQRGASRRKRRNLYQAIHDTVVGCLIAFNLRIVKMPTIYIHKMYIKTYAARSQCAFFSLQFIPPLAQSPPGPSLFLVFISFSLLHCKHAASSIEDIHSHIRYFPLFSSVHVSIWIVLVCLIVCAHIFHIFPQFSYVLVDCRWIIPSYVLCYWYCVDFSI